MKIEANTDLKQILFPKVNFDVFKTCLERAKPNMTIDDLKKYEKFSEEFDQEE